jgi:rhamnosyltransferase
MIAAIVVLYYPDRLTTARLLSSLEGQVDTVIAVDNTPGISETMPLLFQEYCGPVEYIPLGSNNGIAEAQNIGIMESIRAGFTHVLLLDQDSNPSVGMVRRLLDAERMLQSKGEMVAVVAPQIIDEKTGVRPSAVAYKWFRACEIYSKPGAVDPIRSENLICSGSLIQTRVFNDIGLMRSDMFIDGVDTEWMLRSQNAGYSSYCIPDAVMIHNLGDGAILILNKKLYVYSSVRNYYRVRNEVYLAGLKTMGWQWRAYALSLIPFHVIMYAAIANNRCEAIRLIIKGIVDGVFGRLGPLSEKYQVAKNDIE